jgi:hypothetical protein
MLSGHLYAAPSHLKVHPLQAGTALSAGLWNARASFANRYETPLLNTLLPEVCYTVER